jgi:cell division protein FtsB
VSVAALVLFGPGAVQWLQLEWRQRRLDRQLAELQAKQQQLIAEEARLRSDPAYVEGLIRTTFKYAKPGELVIPLEADRRDGKSR